MIQKISQDLKTVLPDVLVDALLVAYEEIKQNFYLGKHEASELNGGKLVEAIVRVLQYETNGGQYTPVGVQIKDMIGTLRQFEQLTASGSNESFRIHLPRVLVAIYNVRNKRGVGHLGGDVSPNHADASLIASCADWAMAELFRIYYLCSLSDAQGIVDGLVQRRLALVHELETSRRVLLPELTQRDQTLLLLASLYPKKVAEADLLAWVEPKNKSTYRRLLRNMHELRLIEYTEAGAARECELLPTGLRYVEAKHSDWLRKLDERN